VTTPVNIPALLHKANPTVKIENGQVITSSVEVARVFDKRHDDVLKSIRKLRSDVPAECLRNFAEASVEVRQPRGGTASYPVYHLTRDGFTLLAMGFTGKKALAFKLAYIDAFNRMEATLSGADNMPANRPAEVPPAPPSPLPLPPVSPPTKTLTFSVPVGGNDHRWLLHTDRHGREHVTALSHDTHIGTPAQLVQTLMESPADLHLSLDQQLTIVGTFLRNAHHAAAGYGKRLDLKPGSRT